MTARFARALRALADRLSPPEPTAAYFSNSANPGGVIEVDGVVDALLTAQWRAKHR